MAKSKTEVELRLNCGHKMIAATRPNPRKVWPDPQTCSECKKKMRVVEIKTLNPPVTTRLTSPTAPKKYIKKLQKGAK